MSLAEPLSPFRPDHAIGLDLSPIYDDMSMDLGSDENAGPTTSTHYTFTPNRLKRQPRAWERKPSTPHLPRYDAQKIWKRVPLQNVSSNINATWRRGATDDDGVMRPVKKLRTVAAGIYEEKENSNYISSKWNNDDQTEVSPRRRQPQVPNNRLSPRQAAKIQTFTPVNVDCFIDENTTEQEDQHEQHKTADNLTNTPKLEAHVMTPRTSDASDYFSSEEFSPVQSCVDPQLLQLDQQRPDEPEVPEQHGVVFDENVQAESIHDDAYENTDASARGTVPHALNSASTHDEDQEGSGRESNVASKEDIPVETPISTAENEHDDTSYLQRFLLRAQAQRTGKPAPGHPSDEIDEDDGNFKHSGSQNEPAESDVLENDINEDEFIPSETTAQADFEEQEEERASSPCRRSNRVVTRLPRLLKPTTIPSNISLRRLNGNEFISMQKDIQNLAMMTRANTKKNKCDAIPVFQRLLQLKDEIWQGIEEEVPRKQGRKAVSWAATLARFQDESGKEVAIPTITLHITNPQVSFADESKEGEQLHAEPNTSEIPGESLEADVKKEKKRKVRKQRKENSGTENGTPAPKRTMQMMLEEASKPQEKPIEEKVEKIEMKQIPRKTRTSARTQARIG